MKGQRDTPDVRILTFPGDFTGAATMAEAVERANRADQVAEKNERRLTVRSP